MKGVDLVTEGVITMSRVVEYAKAFVEGTDLTNLWSVQTDGASQIAQLLFEYATDINFFIGKAINPAHQNPDLPITFGIKIRLVQELSEYLEKRGKQTKVSSFKAENPAARRGFHSFGGFSYTDNNHTADMEINRR